ncbi:MAG: acyl-CoA dehydrogenase family protein [Deltaproteobacteria bacterium]|nr:acyl-CoA dehydrogenase family protein [Deltaproteobacteria bacterium]
MFDNQSKELQEMRESVRKLAHKLIPQFRSSEFYNTVPRRLFSSFAELGLAGLSIPEDYDGIAASAATSAAVLEEVAAVDLGPAIFISVHSMVSGIIARGGSEDQKRRYLPKMSSGEFLGAFALTEPSAGSDARNLKSSAKRDGDTFILNGSKCYITSAGWADLYVTFAKTSENGEEGISCFIVEANTPGLIISSPEKKMGCELSPIASLTFENMRLAKSQLLGTLHKGYATALGGLAGGRVNIAACANGLSRTAIEKAVAHLNERQQFGSKLMEFQGLQFMLADMQMKYEAARLLTLNAADLLDQATKSPEARMAPSIAKCYATDAAMQITTDAVQLLGGAGYIKDYDVERLMRDAKMLQIVEGTNQIQRMLIARELAKAAA